MVKVALLGVQKSHFKTDKEALYECYRGTLGKQQFFYIISTVVFHENNTRKFMFS